MNRCTVCHADPGEPCKDSFGRARAGLSHRGRVGNPVPAENEPRPFFGRNWEGWRVLSDPETREAYATKRAVAHAVRASEDEHRAGLEASREAMKVHPRPIGIRADGSCTLPVGHPLVSKYLATGILTAGD